MTSRYPQLQDEVLHRLDIDFRGLRSQTRLCPLGRVDGFDQDEAADQGDEGAIVLGGLFAPQSDALEALDLAVGLLDARAAFVQDAWEEFRSCEIGSVGDHRADAAITCGLPIGCGI